MTFREWLPITTRNRVALGLSFAALAIFVTWNCLPYYEYMATSSEELVMTALWPEIFSPDNYLDVLKSPDIDGFLVVTASMALIQSGLIILLAVPFWKFLHGSAFIRIPVALMNMLGGTVIVWFINKDVTDDPPLWLELIALSMFTLAAALFTFRNELALRELRDRPQTD